MDEFKWTTLDSRYIIKDNWISLRADKCMMPNGKIIEPYYVLEYPSWVSIFAMTKKEEVILVRQYRHGNQKTSLELPAGRVEDSDESPAEAAKRELLEETGFTGDRFIEISRLSPNPSNHNNLTYSYLALDVERVAKPKLDAGEEIEVVIKTLDEVVEMLKEQEFLQSLQICTMFYGLKYLEKIKL